MATVGSSITAADFNAIQTRVQTVLGTYYGQALSSSAISTPVTNQNSTIITALQWNNLAKDLLTCYNHQSSTNGNLPVATTSNQIKYSDLSAYDVMGTSILSNYLQFFSGYSSSSAFTTVSYGSGWGQLASGTQTLRHRLFLQFPSAAAAGYFFNAGGQISFSASMTGGQIATVGTKDYSWSSMLSHMGTIVFTASSTFTAPGATTPGTGSSIGYNQLTSSPVLIYEKLTEAATYSPNKYRIFANWNSGTNTIEFYIEFEDLSGALTAYTIDEVVTGTTQSFTSMKYANGGPTGYTMSVDGYKPSATTNAFDIVSPTSP